MFRTVKKTPAAVVVVAAIAVDSAGHEDRRQRNGRG